MPASLQMPVGAEGHGAGSGEAVVGGRAVRHLSGQGLTQVQRQAARELVGKTAAVGCLRTLLCPQVPDQALFVSPGTSVLLSVPAGTVQGGARRTSQSCGAPRWYRGLPAFPTREIPTQIPCAFHLAHFLPCILGPEYGKCSLATTGSSPSRSHSR